MALAVLDSNALIYHVGGLQTIPDLLTSTYAVSSVIVFELLRFPGMSKQEESSLIKAIDYCEIVGVTEAIAFRAAFLSRIRPRGKAMDIFIAATALELDIPLITGNIKDFKNIPGLQVKSEF